MARGVMLPKDRDHLLKAELISWGAQKLVVSELFGYPLKGTAYDAYTKMYVPLKHNRGVTWLRSRHNLPMADRIIRVYEVLCGEVDAPTPIDKYKFRDVCATYFAMYPKDKMSVNRIYYLIKELKSGSLSVIRNCSSCKEVFLYRDMQFRKCGACSIMSDKDNREDIIARLMEQSRVDDNLTASA